MAVSRFNFRAWDRGEDYHRDDPDWRPKMHHNVQNTYDGNVCDAFRNFIDNPERFVLMQSTGLTDKNGREIFEGDLIGYSYPAGESRCVVTFGLYDNGEMYEDNVSGFGWFLEERVYCSRATDTKRIHPLNPSDYPLCSYSIEVIGNIYENPELLKQED